MSENLKQYIIFESIAQLFEMLNDDEKNDFYCEKASDCWTRLELTEREMLNNRPLFHSPLYVLSWNVNALLR